MTSPADAQPMPSHPDDADDRLRGLRILHATDTFLPNVGGLELAIAALVRSQVRRGRVVAVATPLHPDAPAREDLDAAQVHRLPMAMARVPGAYADPTHLFFPPVPDPRFARAFADLIRRFRPDVIHAHGWIIYSVVGAARRAGIPVVATAHDHGQVCATKIMLYHGRRVCSGPGLSKCIGCAYSHYGLKGIPLAAGLHELGSRRHRDVAQWTAISSALAARGSAPRPADRSPMEVIPTFIDDDLLALASDERSAARPDFVPATGAYLFYAGALGIYKGVDVLLDAHARLRAGGLDIPLVLAGLPRGDFRMGDRSGVVVVTNVLHPDVVAAWRHAVVGVVPSLVPEGFGLVAVECLAAGTPCVVSALGGLLDVVADGVEGLHVPPGDAEALACALRRLLDDEGLRSRLGAAGPAKAARFTLSQVIPRLDEVYLRVMADAEVGRGPSRVRECKTSSAVSHRSDVNRGAFSGDTDPGWDADMMGPTAEGSQKRAELATMPLVLMYHSISPYDEDPYEVTMTPERFERHMRWLRGRGLRGVSMVELLSARAEGRGRGLVGLTFDDGYQDFVTYAMPVLQQYGFTATAYVLAGRLGGDDAWNSPSPAKALLTADQVCQAAHSGMEIGSHGLDHVSLPEADDTRLSAETVRSRAILQELIGQQIRGFCYPYGHVDTRVMKATQAAGYEYACATGPSAAIGRHAIPRTHVHDRDTSWRLDAKRIRSGLTVGNRIAVRRHRGNARSSQVEYL